MKGLGGMLSFEVNSARQDAVERFLDRLSVIQPALSLGGVESLICVPALTSHVKMSKAEREKIGISEGLLRLSVGIENKNDLIADLEQALNNSL
jgi:cystathionine beta-lyase